MSGPAAYIGHEAAWEAWRSALGGQRLHHAWLLAGRAGLGKSIFARAAARELVAAPGIPQPTGDHPDILVLSHLPKDDDEARKRDKGEPFETRRNITIDQVRQLQRSLTTRPTLGPRRAVIFDPADDLEPNAANALLKSLEEPPQGTVFLLVAHRPGRLLPTIRSRCRLLRFPDVDAAGIRAVLAREAPGADAELHDAAVRAAAGSPGAALAFVELDLGPMHGVMRRLVRLGDADFRLRAQLAEAMGKRPTKARQAAAIELARAVLRERMRDIGLSEIPAVVEANAELTRLAAEVTTYNYDAGLLLTRLGGLLAHLAAPRGGGDG